MITTKKRKIVVSRKRVTAEVYVKQAVRQFGGTSSSTLFKEVVTFFMGQRTIGAYDIFLCEFNSGEVNRTISYFLFDKALALCFLGTTPRA